MPPRLTLPVAKASRAAPANLTAAKEEFEVEGVVVSVAEESFLLNGGDSDRYTVVVNEETEFKDLDGLADLEAGDTVQARGELDGTVITASRVELREGGDDGGGGGGSDDDGVDFESTGIVTELLPPDSFAFSDQRTYGWTV